MTSHLKTLGSLLGFGVLACWACSEVTEPVSIPLSEYPFTVVVQKDTIWTPGGCGEFGANIGCRRLEEDEREEIEAGIDGWGSVSGTHCTGIKNHPNTILTTDRFRVFSDTFWTSPAKTAYFPAVWVSGTGEEGDSLSVIAFWVEFIYDDRWLLGALGEEGDHDQGDFHSPNDQSWEPARANRISTTSLRSARSGTTGDDGSVSGWGLGPRKPSLLPRFRKTE